MAGKGNVKDVDDSTFDEELTNAGNKLVVVDFHATWCGPCKVIAPLFIKLSTEYPQAVFLRVDVDEATITAEKYGITAMPTFVFIYSKVKVKELRGGDANEIKKIIASFCGSPGESASGKDGVDIEEDSSVPGHSNLAPFLLSSGCDCLNESDEHVHKNIFSKNDSYLESDCDEQLMLTLSFNQAVKVHSIKLTAPSDGRGPKTIKIFVNQPNSVDFDQGERMEGVQQLILEESDLNGEKIIPLRFVKFQNVSSIVFFVVDNQGGDEVTVINNIRLLGSPLVGTNMGDFKRVAGKTGESH